MKKIVIFVCALLMLSTGGCAKNERPSSIISQTTEDFDLKTAQDMVQELERPVLELKIGSVVTRSEFEEMQKKSELFTTIDGTNVLYTFFDVAEIEDTSKQEFEVLGNNHYPTIFDENIVVAKAYVETTVYDLGGNRIDTRIILHIEEEYIGDDNEMNTP